MKKQKRKDENGEVQLMGGDSCWVGWAVPISPNKTNRASDTFWNLKYFYVIYNL